MSTSSLTCFGKARWIAADPRPDSPTPLCEFSCVTVPVAFPNANTTNTSPSQPHIASLRCSALHRPARAARFRLSSPPLGMYPPPEGLAWRSGSTLPGSESPGLLPDVLPTSRPWPSSDGTTAEGGAQGFLGASRAGRVRCQLETRRSWLDLRVTTVRLAASKSPRVS